MAKEKQTEEGTEIITFEGGLPAEIGESVLTYLDLKADEVYEPGFVTYKIAHQTGDFSAAGHGSVQELEGIILAIEITRAIWFNGTKKEMAEVEGWTHGLPICASRNNNGSKGVFPQILNEETPPLVKAIMEPVLAENFTCGKGKDCPWNAFGSSGRGKLCKENRRLLMWSPDGGVAVVVSIPPSSLRAWEGYRAGFQDKHFSRKITRLSLSVVGEPPNKYSVVNFTAVKDGNVTSEMVAGLGRKVQYGGGEVMEAEALVSEFLNLSIDRELDYPDNGGGTSPPATPESEDDF